MIGRYTYSPPRMWVWNTFTTNGAIWLDGLNVPWYKLIYHSNYKGPPSHLPRILQLAGYSYYHNISSYSCLGDISSGPSLVCYMLLFPFVGGGGGRGLWMYLTSCYFFLLAQKLVKHNACLSEGTFSQGYFFKNYEIKEFSKKKVSTKTNFHY